MTTAPQARLVTPREFENGQQWLDALGGVPMSRIVFNPWPGTATEADLVELAEKSGRLCELVDGTLVEKTMGSSESVLAGWILTYVNNFLESHDIGIATGADGMMRILPGRVRAPDVAFLDHKTIGNRQLSKQQVPRVSPDLAVEVLSPSNTVREMNSKLTEYFESGCRLVWIVDPRAKTVAVYDVSPEAPGRVLTEADTLDGGSVLPGFTVSLAKLFSKLPK